MLVKQKLLEPERDLLTLKGCPKNSYDYLAIKIMVGVPYTIKGNLRQYDLFTTRLLALPTNIRRLGWKGLPGTNALAYYEKL